MWKNCLKKNCKYLDGEKLLKARQLILLPLKDFFLLPFLLFFARFTPNFLKSCQELFGQLQIGNNLIIAISGTLLFFRQTLSPCQLFTITIKPYLQ